MKAELTRTRRATRSLSVRDSTTGLWRFRNNLLDSSGNGHTLEPNPNTLASHTWEKGITEAGVTAFGTHGGQPEGVRLAAAAATDFDMGTDDFSVELWLMTIDPFTDWPLKKLTTPPNKGFAIGLASGSLYILLGDGSIQKLFVSATTWQQVLHNRWDCWAFTVDRTADNLRFYLNGVEDANSPLDISGLGSISNTSADLLFGDQYRGHLDEVCISEEVLSAAVIADRYAGVSEPYIPIVANELEQFLPSIHQGSPGMTEFLQPFEPVLAGLRSRAQGIKDLVRPDSVPIRFMPHLASLFNFEMPEITTMDDDERRVLFDWIPWLYKRKGTHACAQKLVELTGFTASTNNQQPPSYPFIANAHRTYGYALVAELLFSDDFSGNLGAWDVPLSPDTIWRQQNGGLYERTFAEDQGNGRLFDCDATDFYIEADIKLIDAIGGGKDWGFYIAWQDEDNWIRLGAQSATSTISLGIESRSNGGSVQMFLLQNIHSSFNVRFVAGETYKVWFYVDLLNETFTGGIDTETLMLDEVQALPRIAGTKKGIWAGAAGTEVEWDNVRVLNPRNDLAAILPAAGMVGRALVITLSGNPTNAVEKQGWVQKVVPRYIPFGIPLLWAAVPTGRSVSCVADNALANIGDVFSGTKGASATTDADGAVGVQGSITLTPAAATLSHCVADFFASILFGYARTATTDSDGAVASLVKNIAAGAVTGTTDADGASVTLSSITLDMSGANAAKAGTQTGGIERSRIMVHQVLDGLYRGGDDDPSVVTLISKAALCDGNKTTAFMPGSYLSEVSLAGSHNGDIYVVGFILHDVNSANPDGISSATSQNKIRVWTKDTSDNPDNNKFTLQHTFTQDDFFRRNQKIEVGFFEDKILVARNGGLAATVLVHIDRTMLKDSGDNYIEWSELEIIQYVIPL